MFRKVAVLVFSVFMSLSLEAATPAEKIIDASIQAAGGRQAFEALGVLKMEITESETQTDGKTKKDSLTAYVDTTLANSRLELPSNVVIVRNGDTGWASISGKLDTRKQTPRMAPGTCRQKLMPLLLPFSLKLDGPGFSQPTQTNFQGQKMWKIGMIVKRLFFQSPMISNSWDFFFPLDSNKAPIARYLPLAEFIKVQPEGMQIEVIKRTRVGGVLLPSSVTIHGVDATGKVSSHERRVSISYTIVKDPDLGLFVSPETLQKLDEGSPVD